MRDDPILSDRLIQLHTDEPYRSLRNRMHKLADEQTDAMHALIAKAYTEGVRDGFVQGVAAAARDTNEPKDLVTSYICGDEASLRFVEAMTPEEFARFEKRIDEVFADPDTNEPKDGER